MRSVRKRRRVNSEEALSEALLGERLDAMPELPRTVFLLRRLDGLHMAAIVRSYKRQRRRSCVV